MKGNDGEIEELIRKEMKELHNSLSNYLNTYFVLFMHW
jgi:hypothetical protein